MTAPDPELAAGAEDDPSEPELELAAEPVVPESSEPSPDAELPGAGLPGAGLPDAGPADVPDDVPAALLELVCVEPGRLKATAPATATPRIPAPTVTARSLCRARSRSTTADTARGSLLSIGTPPRHVTSCLSPVTQRVSPAVICPGSAQPLAPL
ncbi:MAG TPA: hypothetical protein VMV92_13135 [Streptosporangiaceae bacterium]|nr:hypothetical protein [Streptosporangiaceae bacterium]